MTVGEDLAPIQRSVESSAQQFADNDGTAIRDQKKQQQNEVVHKGRSHQVQGLFTL
mgnify:CR=1 FL=1